MKKRKLLILFVGAICIALAAGSAFADLATGVTLDFNANDPASGIDDSSWLSLTEINSRDWTGMGSSITLTNVSSGTLIEKAYRFDGGGGATNSSWDGPFNEQDDATWEVWLKPADTGEANQTILESGAGGDGFAIWYTVGTADDGTGTINFTIDNGNNQNTVSAEIDTSEFTHIAAVYDRDSDGSVDLMQIYVDGELIDDNTGQSGNTDIHDWAGGDGCGLGQINGGTAATSQGGVYTGDISVLRFWEGKALTEAEITDNYELLAGGIITVIYPENGAVVPPGDVTLEWINYDDPCNPGTDVLVDVYWGSDPNRYTGTFTQVVDDGSNVTTATISPEGPGVYYWYVDTTITLSSGDPCTMEGRVYNFTNDGPIASVDAGPDMVTWAGEPVGLAAGVTDDGGSPLTYSWTADVPSGVTAAFNPSADVSDTAITLTMEPYDNAAITNSGFEADELADAGWGSAPGWTSVGAASGSWNPAADGDQAAYGGIVPEGDNVAWVGLGNDAGGGIAQVLKETFAANTGYTLEVEVGKNGVYDWPGYKVQLLAGGAVIAEDDNTLNPATGTFETSVVDYIYDEVADANKIGEPLEVRLLVKAAPGTNWAEMNFDDVRLTASTPFPAPETASVDVTLTVQDAINPAVSDTMTIDVYPDACQAARNGVGTIFDTDYNDNCQVFPEDLATMAAAWLNDTSATEAVVNPEQPDGNLVVNGDFETIVKPGTTMPAYVADGNYWRIGNPGNMHAGATATYSDGTTGSSITTPGWVIAEGSNGNADCMQAGSWGGPDGSGDIAALCFASWGGPTVIESAAPLSLPVTGPGGEYELSADVYHGGGPVVLELLVDGAVVEPKAESTPAMANNTWVEFTRTYSSIPAGDVKIRVGTRDDAGTGWTGNRASVDNIALTLTADPVVPSVEGDPDMVTWLGEPVTMSPTVVNNDPNDPPAPLVYNWTVTAMDGLDVTVSDPAIADPTVTVTRIDPYWWEIPIGDPSFESITMSPDGQMKWFKTSETSWRFADPDDTAFESDPPGDGAFGQLFLWNPKAGTDVANWNRAGFDGIVPDGDNCVIVGSILRGFDGSTEYPGGLAKLLEGYTYDPTSSYELSTYIGQTEVTFSNSYGYKVELLAGGNNERSSDQYTDKVTGGTVIGSVSSTELMPAETWEQVTVAVGPEPANADLAGEPLQIRITSLKNPEDPNTMYIMVDDVSLMTDAPKPLEPVEMKLTVNNEGSSTTVIDKMTIDVYETACDVTKAALPENIDLTDHDIDCLTNLADFAVLAGDWLEDYALTVPEEKPVE